MTPSPWGVTKVTTCLGDLEKHLNGSPPLHSWNTQLEGHWEAKDGVRLLSCSLLYSPG